MELSGHDLPNQLIAITGFPNAGKTAILSALQDSEVAASFSFVELPGVVMLGRNTPEEEQVYDFLLGRDIVALGDGPPFGVVAVVDASELSRQMYLAFQLIDLRLPFVLCLTGEAAAAQKGVVVDREKLATLVGVEVISVERDSNAIVKSIMNWRDTDVDKVVRKPVHWRPSMALADAYQLLDTKWIHKHLPLHTGARLVEGLRLLTVPKAVEEYDSHPAYKALLRYLDEARGMLESRNEKWTTAEVIQRNKWITQALQSAVAKVDVNNELTDGSSWWRSLFGKK